MLKPYERNERITGKIVDNCLYYTKPLLYTILKDKDTLYEVRDIPKNIPLGQYFRLKSITGVDNVVIIIDELNHNIYFVDKEHGYSVEPSTNNVILNQHLVGLYKYVFTSHDKGYIIKTNYTSVEELITKLSISVRSGFDFLQTGNIDSVIVIEG